jgi:hypothetical protein
VDAAPRMSTRTLVLIAIVSFVVLLICIGALNS